MWMMGGHERTHHTVNPISEQIDELGAEIERLTAEGTTDSRSGACDVGIGWSRQAETTRQVAPGAESIYYLGT